MSAASFMSQENYKRKNLQNFYLQNLLLKKSGSIILGKPVLNSLTVGDALGGPYALDHVDCEGDVMVLSLPLVPSGFASKSRTVRFLI